ncbi:hypothetical protein F0000_24155 [Aquimarina sp. RZ0]|nr:hypothetical protein F0000_24155 [Aquimarina sp. RZ0]
MFLSFFIPIKYQCNCQNEFRNSENKNSIIFKGKYKKSETETDTLWVSHNDTIVFKKEEVITTRPCSNPELSTKYNLITPINNAYYFIYNEKQQLIKEGKYTYEYTHIGATKKSGSFYNSKDYHYDSNGCVDIIYYTADGRNHKAEHFDKKNRLNKIRYFDKKSSDIEKIEIYKKGKLKETKIYTSFNKYYTIKASD